MNEMVFYIHFNSVDDNGKVTSKVM